MSRSGVSVDSGCLTHFNELKLNREHKYIIFKISSNGTTIVVEETSSNKDWKDFSEKLENAGPRYAVYDVEYELASGEGTRNKITFIAWVPDTAGVKLKMLYSSSKHTLKDSLTGLSADIQANDPDDIEWSSVVNKVSKGLAA